MPSFSPVPVRTRHDGWSPEQQGEFIEALAQSGCVNEACRRVGKSPSSAYALRQRASAQSFRMAWDAALDYGVKRLTDAAFSRAIYGVENPIFFQGEQVGVRRAFNDRLAMFILRYRDPERYGKWRDDKEAKQHADGPALLLNRLCNQLADDAWAEDFRHAQIDATDLGAEQDEEPEVEEEEADGA